MKRNSRRWMIIEKERSKLVMYDRLTFTTVIEKMSILESGGRLSFKYSSNSLKH